MQKAKLINSVPGGLSFVPVSLHDLGSPDDQLPSLAGPEEAARVHVDDVGLCAWKQRAYRAGLDLTLHAVAQGGQSGLRHPEPWYRREEDNE